MNFDSKISPHFVQFIQDDITLKFIVKNLTTDDYWTYTYDEYSKEEFLKAMANSNVEVIAQKIHIRKDPINSRWNRGGVGLYILFWDGGKPHREDAPAVIEQSPNDIGFNVKYVFRGSIASSSKEFFDQVWRKKILLGEL